MDRNAVLTRRAYYKQATENDEAEQQRALQLCKNDIVFFVNHFCWCFEPRTESEFPIVLFDYQRWALREWVQIFDFEPGDIVVEKARDMGITWLWLYTFIWYWLFRANSSFLISSYREQEVDYQDSMHTLFPKMRFVIDKLPDWMKPKGYNPKKHATYMRLFNPENKSIITGSAPVSNYGRGGRFKAIFFDELPQWPFSRSSWDSASQSTNIRIANGTPWGRDNIYAELALDPTNHRIEYPGA